MMVKNEAHIIRRALESAKPYIDYWIICDTGSADDTPAVIADAMRGIPGQLHHTPWKNFGHNRTEVLTLASGKADYLLVIDADMIVNVKAPFKHKLRHDYYEIRYEGDLDYTQSMLVSSHHQWRYIGVTHEYIFADTASTWDFLPELSLTHIGDGGCRSDKYERDVQLLTEALKTEPGNERYKFYLAQSYKDLGLYDQALYWYEQRMADRQGWEEERWFAMYMCAEMKCKLGYPWPDIQSAYLAAFDARPLRIEPIYGIAKYYREEGQYFQGYMFASMALQGLHYPVTEKLFIEKPVYDYLLLFEFMICAYAYGRNAEAIEAANILLSKNGLPAGVYDYAIQARTAAGNMLRGEGNTSSKARNRIVVITPFYNAGHFLQACTHSLLTQDYDNFEVIFIDDASTDSNKDFVPPAGLQARIIRNKKRKGAACNLYHAITQYCHTDDIVVCVDGDDALAGHNVLSTINQRYVQYDCWVMYGQYVDASGQIGISAPYASPKDFANLRSHWRSSHIRTFRAGLFHAIATQDPEYLCMKDEDGNWLTSAVDGAIMYPLLEMAGFQRVYFNETILYRYNSTNPISHHFSNKKEQQYNFDRIIKMRPFAKITSYHSSTILTAVS
jgi:glycosyltransferase involved in cell wall biosynthesis